jgi:hypothetical protein
VRAEFVLPFSDVEVENVLKLGGARGAFVIGVGDPRLPLSMKNSGAAGNLPVCAILYVALR